MEQQLGLSPWQDTAALKRSVQAVHQHMQDVIPALLQQQEELLSQTFDLKRASKSHTSTTDSNDLNLEVHSLAGRNRAADHCGPALQDRMVAESDGYFDQTTVAAAGPVICLCAAGLLPASVSPARLRPASVSPARLLVAVSARLCQKQMLEAITELCKECIRALNQTPAL